MKKQLMISISREAGSGGYEIASALAKKFDLPLYDKNILEQVAKYSTFSLQELKHYDESPRSHLLSRTVHGFNNSPQAHVAEMQFRLLKEKAAAGESFVLVGRCGEEVLKNFPGLVSIYIHADTEFRKVRTMTQKNVNANKALGWMAQTDRRRKNYHNQYCQGKWGDPHNYDLCISSARSGIQGTIEHLSQYIQTRLDQM